MKIRTKGKKKTMTEEKEVVETETIRTPDGKEVAIPVQDYRVKVTTYFSLKAPVVTGEEAFKALAHLVWENMPAGNIGENFFVQFPRGFADLQVNVDVETLAEFNAKQEELQAALGLAEEIQAEGEAVAAPEIVTPEAEQAEVSNG